MTSEPPFSFDKLLKNSLIGANAKLKSDVFVEIFRDLLATFIDKTSEQQFNFPPCVNNRKFVVGIRAIYIKEKIVANLFFELFSILPGTEVKDSTRHE